MYTNNYINTLYAQMQPVRGSIKALINVRINPSCRQNSPAMASFLAEQSHCEYCV